MGHDHDEMRDKVISAIHQARGEGFLDEHEVPPLLAWVNAARDALTGDPTDMPEGPARTGVLRQMLIDTMWAVEQTDDGDRMAAALNAFDAEDAALREPPAPCEHVFSDADGRTRYTFCQRGCGTRDPAESPATEAAEWDAAGAVAEAMLGIDSGPRATPEAEAIRVAAAATDDRPSIAELQRIEGAMTVAPWDSGEDPRDDGEVCDPNLKCVAKVRGNVEANTVGIAALRNAAPVLLEIAAAALAEAAAECTRQEPHWDYVEGGSEDVSCFKDIHCKVCPVSVARAKFDTVLAKVRE
jgi:hypothetical protein